MSKIGSVVMLVGCALIVPFAIVSFYCQVAVDLIHTVCDAAARRMDIELQEDEQA